MRNLFISLVLLLLNACSYTATPYGYNVSVDAAYPYYYSPYRYNYYTPHRYITPYYRPRGYWYGGRGYPHYYGNHRGYYGNHGGYYGNRGGYHGHRGTWARPRR